MLNYFSWNNQRRNFCGIIFGMSIPPFNSLWMPNFSVCDNIELFVLAALAVERHNVSISLCTFTCLLMSSWCCWTFFKWDPIPSDHQLWWYIWTMNESQLNLSVVCLRQVAKGSISLVTDELYGSVHTSEVCITFLECHNTLCANIQDYGVSWERMFTEANEVATTVFLSPLSICQ